jgi:L-iditol 2-dehydrogenase
MRVAMYYNNRDIRIEEMPLPKISENELLVKVIASGICGSDVMEWYRLKKAPLVLGHEITGEIAEVGEGLKGYKVGNRVFVSHHVPCNACRYCLSGHHTACETLYTTNYFPGGFSEYIRAPALNVERGTFLLPDGVSYEEGTFIEPLACVVRGQGAAGLRPGQSMLILGSGTSGLLHLLFAKTSGAQRIIMADINTSRLRMARELGADYVINAKEDVISFLRKVNENRLADLVVICASAASVFNQALASVERAGTILCFAPTEPGITLAVPVNDFWRKNIKIIHSYGAGPRDLEMAIGLLREKRVVVNRLITHRLRLLDIGLGFQLVVEAKECLKVIIEPQR